MKGKRLISMIVYTIAISFLWGCMTPTQIVDTGRRLKMMSWSNKESHYQQLMNQGKYEELIKEYEKFMVEARKKGQRAPQIEKANRIATIYLNNLKDYSKAIDYGERALTLAEEGKRMGPENEVDENFYPQISAENRKMYGPQWVKKTKIEWYANQMSSAMGSLSAGYKKIGNTKKSSYYQSKLMASMKPADEILKEHAEKQSKMADKQKVYLEKRYGKRIATGTESSQARLDEYTKQASERQKQFNEIMARMNNEAVRGDLSAVKSSIQEYAGITFKEYSKAPKGSPQSSFMDAMKNSMAADFSMRYGLYDEALTYSLRGLEAIEKSLEFFKGYSKQAFFTSDRKKIMSSQEATHIPNQTKCLIIAGKSLNRMKQFKKAIPYLTRACNQKEVGAGAYMAMSSAMEPKMEAHYELARSYRYSGMNAKAIETYGKLIGLFEGIRAHMTKETHKIGYMGLQNKIYDEVIYLLLKEGRVGEAFEYSERSRARALVDLLAGKELRPKSEKTRILMVEKRSLDNQLAAIAKQKTGGESRERSIQVVEKKMDAVLTKMGQEDAELVSMTSVRTMSVKEIQKLLEMDTALIEYHVTDDGIIAWVITNDTIHVKSSKIPVWVLANKIIDFRQGVTTPRESAREKRKEETTSQVRVEITPARFKNGESYTFKVYVKNELPLFMGIDEMETRSGEWATKSRDILEKEIPGGVESLIVNSSVKWKITPGLHSASLKTDQGNLSSNILEISIDEEGFVSVKDRGFPEKEQLMEREREKYASLSLSDILIKPVAPYLVGKKRVGIVPSGILHYIPFAALKKQDRYFVEDYTVFYLPSATVLQFCRNKRKSVTGQILALGNPDLKNSQMDIPFALEEVRKIGELYEGSQILVRGDATETAFCDLCGSFDIIHCATHGTFDANRPLESALLLAPQGENDGRLTVNEIFNIDLTASMVTLSACQSGMSRIRAGDEMMGIPRAFIYAGVPTVVASLWNVNDEATAILMEQFYRNLKKYEKGEALQRAQRYMIEKSSYKNPYYWAAFSLTGDYK